MRWMRRGGELSGRVEGSERELERDLAILPS
jgi:hypothetical protein